MPKRQQSYMLKAERFKLERDFPTLIESVGFEREQSEFEFAWVGWSKRSNCKLHVILFLGEGRANPWLATQFQRDPLYTPWQMDDPRNRLYPEMHSDLGANVYSGKYNCHLFTRYTADQALAYFRQHLLTIDPAPFLT